MGCVKILVMFSGLGFSSHASKASKTCLDSFCVKKKNSFLFFLVLKYCIERARLLKLGTLSKDVFERRRSTGSEAFSLFICLDANKLVLLSFFSLLKTIYPRVSTKPLPNDAKSPLPVDVRRSKTLLLELSNHE